MGDKMTLTELADRLEAMGKAATQGLLEVAETGRDGTITGRRIRTGDEVVVVVYDSPGPERETQRDGLAALIVSLRNNLPALVAALRAGENLRRCQAGAVPGSFRESAMAAWDSAARLLEPGRGES